MQKKLKMPPQSHHFSVKYGNFINLGGKIGHFSEKRVKSGVFPLKVVHPLLKVVHFLLVFSGFYHILLKSAVNATFY